MKINWKLRAMNTTTLLALTTVIVTAIYGVLSALGIVPSVTQDQVMGWAVSLISLLAALGIVVDPTTAGLSDSAQAMDYPKPKEKQ